MCQKENQGQVYNNNNNNVYFKSLSYTNVLFKLEMNAQQNKIFWIVRWIKYLQTYKFSSFKVYKFTSLQVYKFTSLKV